MDNVGKASPQKISDIVKDASKLPMGEFILANTMTRIGAFKGLATYYGLDFF